MEGVVTLAPHHHAVLPTASIHLGLGLTTQAGVHHLDPTDCAGVTLDIPAPHGDRVPLLEREHLRSLLSTVSAVISSTRLAILHNLHLHRGVTVLHDSGVFNRSVLKSGVFNLSPMKSGVFKRSALQVADLFLDLGDFVAGCLHGFLLLG